VAPAADQITEPGEPEARALLDRYIEAFETADPAALARLLRQDATLELPAVGSLVRRPGCHRRGPWPASGSPGDWQMLPVAANGQPAAAAYLRDSDGCYRAYGIVVLTVTSTSIARITVFADPGPCSPGFGLPQVQPATGTGLAGRPGAEPGHEPSRR